MSTRPRKTPYGKRCLIVEISDRWSSILQDTLNSLGLEVSIASTFDQARTLLKSGTFDLVVQDLSLDENRQYNHGFELLRYLHTGDSRKIPVIVVSGTTNIQDVVEIVNQYPRVIHFAPKDQFYLTIVRNEFDAAVDRSLNRLPWRDPQLRKGVPQVFVSKSFDPQDSNVNASIESMLHAVGLDTRTGEEYSDASVPEKVKRIIRECDAVVGLFVGEHIKGKWQPVPPPWVVKEVEYAQSIGRQIILVCEEGVKIPWHHDRDLIVFKRRDLQSLSEPAKKFLQSLAFHRLLS